MEKREVRRILSRNPFPHRFTLGIYYREKMRAITSVVPHAQFRDVLEVGGGTSGLSSLLFPTARVVNVDCDPATEEAQSRSKGPALVSGFATRLPFGTGIFDCVTVFDVLEHIAEDKTAAAEILRVLRPGGYLLVTSPSDQWKYPYYRKAFRRICYTEEEVMAQWGHVRRGYSQSELRSMFDDCSLLSVSSYINPLTVIAHDIGFSKLNLGSKIALILLQYPITIGGYCVGWPGPRMGLALAFRKAT